MNTPNRRLLAALAAILAALVVIVIIVAGHNDDEGPPGPTSSSSSAPAITVNGRTFEEVDPPGPVDVLVDTDTQQEPDEQAAGTGLEAHEDLRDETPPGITPAQDDHVDQTADKIADKLTPRPLGGAQGYSCTRHPVVNQSALSAGRVGVALHITVSDPGSIAGIRNLFNSPSAGVSANYGFELYNGQCEQWVDPSRKAWAQGAFNSAYTSIEIISKLRTTASWMQAPAIRDGSLAALVRDELRRIGAPARLVNPVGCTPIAGVVDHDRLECGNDHVDVGNDQGNPSSPTAFPWRFFMAQVRGGTVRSPITPRDRAKCRRAQAYHRRDHHTAAGTRRQQRRYADLKGRGLKCVHGAPKRR